MSGAKEKVELAPRQKKREKIFAREIRKIYENKLPKRVFGFCFIFAFFV